MKSRKGYKQLYNEQFVLKNIELVYKQCTSNDLNSGKTWYENAKSFSVYLSKKYDVTELQSAGVIAALSPMKSWDMNTKIAEEFIETNGATNVHTSLQTSKAKVILHKPVIPKEVELVLGGLKTTNFFHNIYDPKNDEAVTIDRHHLNVCYGKDVTTCTNKQYEFLKKNTIIFAKRVNMIPSELQATLWVCWKRIKKNFVWQK